jgi:hypothetical protein
MMIKNFLQRKKKYEVIDLVESQNNPYLLMYCYQYNEEIKTEYIGYEDDILKLYKTINEHIIDFYSRKKLKYIILLLSEVYYKDYTVLDFYSIHEMSDAYAMILITRRNIELFSSESELKKMLMDNVYTIREIIETREDFEEMKKKYLYSTFCNDIKFRFASKRKIIDSIMKRNINDIINAVL